MVKLVKQKDISENWLMFCQMLDSAASSGIPLSDALREISNSVPMSKASEWGKLISDRLADGHPIEEVVEKLDGIDPLFSSLLKTPQGKGLSEILAFYANHLIFLGRLHENLKTAVLYPMLVFCLAVVNLLLINVLLFPNLLLLYQARNLRTPVMFDFLFFLDPSTWPTSLVIPAIVFFFTFLAVKVFFFTESVEIPESLFMKIFGHITGIHHFLDTETKSRLQGTIALFLGAGVSLPAAIRISGKHSVSNEARRLLEDISKALEEGESVEKCLARSNLLNDRIGFWPFSPTTDQIIKVFQEGASKSEAELTRFLTSSEEMQALIGIIFSGLVVFCLGMAFFQPIYNYIGNFQ